MPLSNRVDPFGAIHAVADRGTMYGNRGGRFHRDDGSLKPRAWASDQWLCCVLAFKGRKRRPLMGRGYTELFFLDEVTALAAGHRPCFECRRADAVRFAASWARAKGLDRPPRAPEMDRALQAERVHGLAQRTHQLKASDLPDGAMFAVEGRPFAVRSGRALAWSFAGYGEAIALPAGEVSVLTPPTIIAVLEDGYRPQWHSGVK
jgi:hypothetical protein